MKLFSFSKKERLCSHKIIEQLFQGQQSFISYPFRLVWMDKKDEAYIAPAQISISVSKRKFKRAVDRNKIKRLIREAYRFNKAELYQLLKEKEKKVVFMLIYLGKEIPTYHYTEKKINKTIKRFCKEIMTIDD